jgi:hypothetical protein
LYNGKKGLPSVARFVPRSKECGAGRAEEGGNNMAKNIIEIKKFDGAQSFKVITLFLVITFAISGVINTIVSLLGGINVAGRTLLNHVILIVLVAPIAGLIFAALAIIYNYVSEKFGGIRMELEVK